MGKKIKILILGAAAVVVAAGAVIVFRLLFCFEKGPDIAIAGREITKEEYIQRSGCSRNTVWIPQMEASGSKR